MNKIDINNWKEFRVGDLFDGYIATSFDYGKTQEGFNNFIGRTSFNNGLQGKVSQSPTEVGNCITISMVGERSAFYQKEPFVASQNIFVLRNDKLNRYNSQFLCSILKTAFASPDGAYTSINKGYILGKCIVLPAINDSPDWTYMEEYMKNIEIRVRDSLTQLESANKIEKHKIDISNWGEFNIVDLFNVSNTHSILKSDVKFGSGNIPYVTASYENNSVASYVSTSKSIIDKGNSILIGGKTMAISYQEDDFVSNDSHNLLLELKKSSAREKYIQLFLVSALRCSFGKKYQWSNSISKKSIQTDTIKLPVDFNGDPNWAYMENNIKNIETMAKNSLDSICQM